MTTDLLDNDSRARTNVPATVAAAVFNALIVLFTVYGIIRFFTVGGSGNMAVFNTAAFRYFTVDSNILVALASLLILIAQIKSLRNGIPVSRRLMAFKHVGATAVGVTFFTVFCFLGTLYGYKAMIEGVSLCMHLMTPLLAMLGFWFLDRGQETRFRSVFLGLLPTALYGVVYIAMTVFQKRWKDFYGFNIGGRWILSCVLMVIATFIISAGLWALHRATGKKNRGEAS
ncbi:MAG: hypothetical protein J5569_01420 [Oscillospiraceae bacterium]|nr:hypothetical protein [Oscillospiraceae bacterium]